MSFGRALSLVGRISPVLSLLLNRIRFPDLRVGVLAEFPTKGKFVRGKDVVVGALSRIYIGPNGTIRLGTGVMLGRCVHLQTDNGNIEINNRTSVQDNCRLYGDVSLGEGCILAPNVYVSSGNHIFDHRPHLPISLQETIGPNQNQPVKIGDDCWIGVNAVIMGGVSVGNGAIIGAGAIVTRDVPAYSIAAGVPARVIGTRLNFAPPAAIDARKAEDWPYFYSGFDKSVTSLATEIGLAAESNFSLALAKEEAHTLLILGQARFKGTTLNFDGQTVSFDCGEARFTLPPIPRGNEPLQLIANNKVIVTSAELI